MFTPENIAIGVFTPPHSFCESGATLSNLPTPEATMIRSIQLAVACLTVLVAGQVQAAIITFDFEYSGSSFGNTASASGTITLDDTLLPNPGSVFEPLAPIVSDLSITVSGASSGNGTFTEGDFSNLAWDTGGITLDLNSELVGQGTLGSQWGIDVGDFNLFGGSGSAPDAAAAFLLETGGGGDQIQLTSFSRQTTAVPEPNCLAILGIGMGLISSRRRRRERKQAATA